MQTFMWESDFDMSGVPKTNLSLKGPALPQPDDNGEEKQN